MNRVLMTAIAGSFALFSGGAQAQDMTLAGAQALLTEVPGASDCTRPTPPAGGIPNGATATEEELLAVVGAVKAFDTASTDFGACLDAAASAMGDGLTEQHNSAIVVVVNSNVDEVIALQEELNAQIRAYNAASE